MHVEDGFRKEGKWMSGGGTQVQSSKTCYSAVPVAVAMEAVGGNRNISRYLKVSLSQISRCPSDPVRSVLVGRPYLQSNDCQD